MKPTVLHCVYKDGTVEMNLSKTSVFKRMLADTKAISNRVRLLNKEALDKLRRGKL